MHVTALHVTALEELVMPVGPAVVAALAAVVALGIAGPPGIAHAGTTSAAIAVSPALSAGLSAVPAAALRVARQPLAADDGWAAAGAGTTGGGGGGAGPR